MEEFYVLSQLAIATAGFAALASLLKPKSEKTDLDYKLNLARFYVMIELAVTVAAFGFLPAVISSFLPEGLSFRISSAIFLIFFLLIYKVVINRNKKLSGKVNIGGMHTIIMRVLALISMLILLIISFGFVKPFYKESYLVALYIIFLLSLNLFYRLIINSVGANKNE